MATKRKFNSVFKVKLVLELLRVEKTLGEIAQEHNLNPIQLSTWRREFLEKAPSIFNYTKAEKESTTVKDRILKTIGQLTMEREFLQTAQGSNRRLF